MQNQTDAQILAEFEAQNCHALRVLKQLGVVQSLRVVHVDMGGHDHVYIEVETPYARGAFVRFQGYSELCAVISKHRNEASVNGTWTKWGKIRKGHVLPWLVQQNWYAGRRGLIKTNNSNVKYDCPWTGYLLAATGIRTGEYNDPHVTQFRQAEAIVRAEEAVERKAKELEAARKLVAQADQAAA